MQPVEAILFEPVGCLAEFSAEPFHEAAARVFGRKKKPSKSASRCYWHLLNLMEASERKLTQAEIGQIESLELEAVAGASLYEDVVPALAELKAMGIRTLLTSSLSAAAIESFLGKMDGAELFDGIWSRDKAGGMKAGPMAAALEHVGVRSERAMFLTDTAEGLKAATAAGVNAILMMNDPDEARRLAMQEPAGGIVSLHELPDFVRLVAAENARA